MQGLHRYKQSDAATWTRIDMLLKLYEAARETAAEGAAQLRQGEPAVEAATRLRMQRLIAQIVDGLDLSQGDLPREIQRLMLFALQTTETSLLDHWESMEYILQTLYEGFDQVREEAIAAERAGEIAPLNSLGRHDLLGMHG